MIDVVVGEFSAQGLGRFMSEHVATGHSSAENVTSLARCEREAVYARLAFAR